MSAEKIVYIENPIPSDDGQVGGEYTNQLTRLLKGVVISNAEEVFTIATAVNFLSGSILLADENNTHKYSIEAENIATGGTRHVRFPVMDTDLTQQVVMTLEPQTITKKSIGNLSKFIIDLDMDGHHIGRLKNINIRDLGDRDISFLGYNGANPNTYFDILSGYNTVAFAGISAATDIELRFGYNSEIDSIEFWSKASGTNEQLIKIFAGTNATTSKIDLNVDIIDFHNPVINNILLGKSQIPATVVHTDQANLYGLFTQDFLSGWLRIKTGSTFVSLGSNTQTGAFSFIIPVLAANDSPAMLGLVNIFSTFQKIQYTATQGLTMYRPDTTVGNGTGIGFHLRNSASAETAFAAIYGVNNQNTAGSELGSIAFYVRNGASFIDRMLLTSDNKLSIGIAGARIVWDPSTINTTSKTFTLPNLSGEVQTLNAVQAPINKIQDVRKNTMLRMARVGCYYASCETGVDADGVLQGLVGIGSQGVTNYNTGGKYHLWQTQGSINDCAGVVKLDGFVTTRILNALLRHAFRFGGGTGANRRMFTGWTAQRLLDSSDTLPLLNTESGFIFGHGALDTTWQIWYNDGTGSCQKLNTGIALPAIDSNLILEIQAEDALTGFRWTLYNTLNGERTTVIGTGLVNTRVPGQLTALYFQDIVFSTTTAVQTNNIHYNEVYN